jgi:transposase
MTSELDKTDEEILDIYKGLWQIEEAFKVTKTDLRSRPVYLSRQDRIEAHFLICFISLYIVRLLAYKLDNKYSISKIISSLNKMSYSFIAQNLYVGNYSDEITIAIKDKLNIDLDRKFITLGEIRKIIGDTKKRSNPQGL